jgi:hypothetical protein
MERMLPYIPLMLAMGCLAGAAGITMWVIDYLRSKKRDVSATREEVTTLKQQHVQPTEEILKPEPPPPLLQAEERQLLSVLRTGTGEWVIQIRGRLYRHLQEITDMAAKEEALEAVKAVLSFAGVPSVPIKSTIEEAFLQHLQQRAAGSAETPGALASLAAGGSSLLSAMDRSIREMVSPPLPEPSLLTPAEQIDMLVQLRLNERPELKRYGTIRVSTGKDGGLRFDVGLRSYQTVDDIAEQDVRAVIEDSIREWREGLER